MSASPAVTRPGRRWLASWIAATVLASWVGGFIGVAILELLDFRDLVDQIHEARTYGDFEDAHIRFSAAWVLSRLPLGITLGLTQWALLRGKVARALWWAPATAAGFLLGNAAREIVLFLVVPQLNAFLAVESPLWILAFAVSGGIVFGSTLGSLQVRVLRHSIAKPDRWIVWTALPFVLGEIAILSAATTDRVTLVGATTLLVRDPLFAVMTGAAMFLLLRRHLEAADESASEPTV